MLGNKKEIIILGAGPAGLCVAFNLAHENNNHITILEKSEETGGLCRTFEHDRCLLDYGPHIIHTIRPEILYFLQKILKDDLAERKTKVNIYFKGKFVPYPIRGIKVLTSLSGREALRACFDYVIARILLTLRDPVEDDSFKNWITNRFGKTLYSMYFGPYAQKAWKISDDQISAYVAKKRVPVVSITDYLRSFIKMKPKNFHSEDPLSIKSYYPKYGVGQVADFLKNFVLDKKQDIFTSSNIVRLNLNGRKFESVTYSHAGEERTISCDFLFSTIAINDFISLINPVSPENVVAAASNLDYCAEKILYIVVDRKNVSDCEFLYFQDPSVRFNRVYLPKRHGPYCIPEDKEVLCVEFTCSVGDAIWRGEDNELFDEAIEVFEKLGLFSRKEVVSFFTKNITHAYPRFRIGFEKNLKTIFSYLQTFQNCVVLGRQGLFCYANLDEVLHMGFSAVEFFRSLQWTGIDYESIFKKYIHIEGSEGDVV